MLLIVVNVDWGRKSRLLRVQDLLRQFEARREATEDGDINNFLESDGDREGQQDIISDFFVSWMRNLLCVGLDLNNSL